MHLKPRTRGVAEKMGNEKITFARWHVGVLACVLVLVLGSKRALELALIWSTEHTELQRFIFTPESTDEGGRFQEGSRPCEPRPYAPRPAGMRALPGEIPNPITGFSDRRSRRKQRAAEARLSEDASPYPVDVDRWTVDGNRWTVTPVDGGRTPPLPLLASLSRAIRTIPDRLVGTTHPTAHRLLSTVHRLPVCVPTSSLCVLRDLL